MNDWSSRLIRLAVVLAAIGLVTLLLGVRNLVVADRLSNGEVLISLSELLITAAGFLFAGVELARTQRQLRKPQLELHPLPQVGAIARSRAEPYLFGVEMDHGKTARDGLSATFSAVVDLYLRVDGDSPVRSFAVVVEPSEWEYIDPSIDNLFDYSLTYTVTPMNSTEGIQVEWKAIETNILRKSLRLQTNDYSILPGDRVLIDSIIVSAEVTIRAGTDPVGFAWQTPTEIEINAFSDNTSPVRITLVLDIPYRVLWEQDYSTSSSGANQSQERI